MDNRGVFSIRPTVVVDNGVVPRVVSGDILLAPEVAALLRMCVKTVYRLSEQGIIPGKRIGRSWRFSRAELLQWIDRR